MGHEWTYPIKRLDVLLVGSPRFRERIPSIFIKDGCMGPLLDLSQATDEAARTVLYQEDVSR